MPLHKQRKDVARDPGYFIGFTEETDLCSWLFLAWTQGLPSCSQARDKQGVLER